MSALGQKRTWTEPWAVTELAPVVKSGRYAGKSGHRATYSITASARASSVGGTLRPSALAALRLMTSSYLVGACTGRLASAKNPFKPKLCEAHHTKICDKLIRRAEKSANCNLGRQ